MSTCQAGGSEETEEEKTFGEAQSRETLGIKRGREGVISVTFFKLDHLVTMLLAEIVELPPSFTSGHTHIPLEMSQTSDPSDERSKLCSGGDEDDDGLDKDLWVVVEKGSKIGRAHV